MVPNIYLSSTMIQVLIQLVSVLKATFGRELCQNYAQKMVIMIRLNKIVPSTPVHQPQWRREMDAHKTFINCRGWGGGFSGPDVNNKLSQMFGIEGMSEERMRVEGEREGRERDSEGRERDSEEREREKRESEERQ
jgi:hypothetical protein